MSNNITPFVKRMRTQGGTFYAFSSAVEDIGLNINERNNIVEMSNFALLNLPEITSPENTQQNKFNVFGIPGGLQNIEKSQSIKDGRIVVAESFQNYALNLESTLLSQLDYNPALLKTVSERVLWKWLKETGAIRWIKDVDHDGYYIEEADTDSSTGYNRVVQYIGRISAGAVRTDNHGTYNETYVLVPTSHGQTKVYFNQNYDDNYYAGMDLGPGGGNILGRTGYKPHPDGLSMLAQYDMQDSATYLDGDRGNDWWLEYNSGSGYNPGWWYTAQGRTFIGNYYYGTDSDSIDLSTYPSYLLRMSNGASPGLGETIEFKRSNVDGLEIEYDITKLRNIFDDDTLTYDKLAIDESIGDKFEFNAIVVYYSIYNKARDKKLTTNLLGILFLDAAHGNTEDFPDQEIFIPTIKKLQSTGSGFGSSYSFRINIKSDNMFDDTQATILDESTSSQTSLENWTDVLSSLSESLNILNNNSKTIEYITDQYMNISNIQTQQADIISDLQYQVNDVATDIKGTTNTIPLFTDGDDPLVDSSIYMRYGNVGLLTNDPQYDVHILGDLKVEDIIFENSIKDASENVVFSSDDYINVGNQYLSKNIRFYTGNDNNVAEIDTDGNFYAAGTVYGDSAMPSDRRLKDNIKPLLSPLEVVLKLNGVSFDWKANGKKSTGFIAQDIEKIIPTAVDKVKNREGVNMLSIKYYEIIPYLVEAIKAQQIMIDKLKNKE